MDLTVGKNAIREATEKLKNWGRWGPHDQIGRPEQNGVGDEWDERLAALRRHLR